MVRRIALQLLFVLVAVFARAEDWPQFRGPSGQGYSTERGVPFEWSETRNVLWKTRVPGSGWSSPVVAGGRVWVTSANSNPTVPVASISVSNAVALIAWSSTSGAVYRVQYKDNLTNSVWNALTPDLTATGSLTSKSDPIGSAQRFYRVLLVQ